MDDFNYFFKTIFINIFKTMIMNTLKVKSILFSLMAVLMVSVFLTSCEQEPITTIESTEFTTLVDRARIFDSPESANFYNLSIGISAIAYRLDKRHPKSESIFQFINKSDSKEDIVPIKITIDMSTALVQDVESATTEEIKSWKNSKGLIWSQQTTDMEIIDIDAVEKSPSVTFNTYAELNNVFNHLDTYTCGFDPYSPGNIGCIPFNYLLDGCYSRAHRMKEILEGTYNKTCHKISVYGHRGNGWTGLNSGCAFGWNFHIAPLVWVISESRWYVVDPSLSNRPLKINEWRSIMGEENICDMEYSAGRTFIPLKFYNGCGVDRDWESASDWLHDDSYIRTYTTNNWYSDKNGCEPTGW